MMKNAGKAAPPEGFRYQADVLPADDERERYSLTAEPRSAYLLRGPSRTEWEHSIPAVDSLRYSITFRSLRADR
jgi:alkylated DNA repair dioxygenase AlkB